MFNKKKKTIDASFNSNDCKRINKLIEQEGGQAQVAPKNHILCSQCKAIIKEDYKFCPICGTKVKSFIEMEKDLEMERDLYPLNLEIKNARFDYPPLLDQWHTPVNIPGIKINVTINSLLYNKKDVLKEIKHICNTIVKHYS